jgi:hypothetical protein
MINWPEMLHHAEDWAAGFWAGAGAASLIVIAGRDGAVHSRHLKPGSARLFAGGAVSVWRFGSGSSDGVRVLVVALPPLSPGHHHIDLPAAAAGADQPLAPIEHGLFGPIPSSHLRGIGLYLMLTALAPNDQPDARGGSVAERHGPVGLHGANYSLLSNDMDPGWIPVKMPSFEPTPDRRTPPLLQSSSREVLWLKPPPEVSTPAAFADGTIRVGG